MRTYHIVLDHSMKKVLAFNKELILRVGIQKELSYR